MILQPVFKLLNRKKFFFEKLTINVLEKNVSAKQGSCYKSNKSFASTRRMEFPMTMFLWACYLVIGVAEGKRDKRPAPLSIKMPLVIKIITTQP